MIVGADLGLLLGAYSNNARCEVEPICFEPEEFAPSGMSFDEVLDILGIEDADAFVLLFGELSPSQRDELAIYVQLLMTM